MMALTFICPTYNNEGSIKTLVKRVNEVAKNLPDKNCNLLFVDDGSKDNTVDEINKNKNEHKHGQTLQFSFRSKIRWGNL